MRENVLIDKSVLFGVRIIKLYQYLIKTKKNRSYPNRSSAAVQVLVQILMRPTTGKAKTILFQKCTLR